MRMAKKIFINYTCPVRVPLVFSRFSLRGRDEMKLLISPEMMITMMQMILTRVRNVAVTGRQSRDGDMRPGLDNGRVFAGPGGPRRCHISGASSWSQSRLGFLCSDSNRHRYVSLFHASQHREGITGPQSPAKRTFVALHFILKYKSDSYL